MCQHKLGMSERAACRVTGQARSTNTAPRNVNVPMILISGYAIGSTSGLTPKATLARATGVRGATFDTTKA